MFPFFLITKNQLADWTWTGSSSQEYAIYFRKYQVGQRGSWTPSNILVKLYISPLSVSWAYFICECYGFFFFNKAASCLFWHLRSYCLISFVSLLGLLRGIHHHGFGIFFRGTLLTSFIYMFSDPFLFSPIICLEFFIFPFVQ
jgi:hypothetical protein